MTVPRPVTAAARWAAASLQRKFALIAGALMLLTSALFLVLVLTLYVEGTLAAHERASLSVNRLLQAALENAMLKRDIDGLRAIVADLGAQEDIAGVMIADPQGEVRFSSYPADTPARIDDPAFHAALETRTQQTEFRNTAEGEVLRSINPVQNKPACNVCHGPSAEHPINGLLILDYRAKGVGRAAVEGALMLGGLGMLVLVAVEGGLWLALRRLVLDRIDRLDVAMDRVAQGELGVHAEERGADEIARLAVRFSAMSDRLKQSVDDIRDSRGFLQDLIDAFPDGVRVIGPDYRVAMANAAFCRQVGRSRDEVVGRPCYTSSHGRTEPCVPTMVCCPLAELVHDTPGTAPAAAIKCNHRHLRSNGSGLSVEVSAVPARLAFGGHALPVVIESIRDLEVALQISHEERISELGLLAAGLAHEIYNPLSTIRLALSAIGTERGLSDQARRYAEIADGEISNCQSFTDGLLRLAARPSEALELVEMEPVLRETAALLAYQSEQTDVRIVTAIEGAPRVFARDSDMRTLIFNLVLNAIHAMPDGGRIDLTCRRAAGRVEIGVADTGVGIPDAVRGKVLLPFWTQRADGTRGRGLGLSVCKSIVDGLGGTLGFESEVGKGTVFHVSLPDADAEES